MCRHLAAVGDALSLHELLFGAPHALARQAEHPHHQKPGTTNPDGWGVAWWESGATEPRVYRRVTPMWQDTEFEELSRDVRCTAVVAAARLASPGATVDVNGNAPFVAEGWAFSLNGIVDDFTAGTGDALQATLSPTRRASIAGDADTEVLFAMVLQHLDAGVAPADALERATADVLAVTTGRLNLLMSDGRTVYATRWRNSLYRLGSLYASEPIDDRPAWTEVDDGSVGEHDSTSGSTRSLRKDLP